jgi:mannose-6-phosphate isomerase-like protein (cupin superfamily)
MPMFPGVSDYGDTMVGMNISHRLFAWLALPATFCGVIALGQTPSAVHGTLSQAKVYPLDQLPVHTMPNGGQVWSILQGTLPTGEAIAVHESEQPAGAVPNPPHRIEHSEVIVVQQGTLEFQHDGKSEKVGAGGVIFVAYGTLHTVKNAGDGPARYTVMQIGGDTRK